MKTAKEKAEHWLNDNVAGWSIVHLESLERLLKEQDRDTRHACAEAVAHCVPQNCSETVIRTDDAHAACMNMRAV